MKESDIKRIEKAAQRFSNAFGSADALSAKLQSPIIEKTLRIQESLFSQVNQEMLERQATIIERFTEDTLKQQAKFIARFNEAALSLSTRSQLGQQRIAEMAETFKPLRLETLMCADAEYMKNFAVALRAVNEKLISDEMLNIAKLNLAKPLLTISEAAQFQVEQMNKALREFRSHSNVFDKMELPLFDEWDPLAEGTELAPVEDEERLERTIAESAQIVEQCIRQVDAFSIDTFEADDATERAEELCTTQFTTMLFFLTLSPVVSIETLAETAWMYAVSTSQLVNYIHNCTWAERSYIVATLVGLTVLIERLYKFYKVSHGFVKTTTQEHNLDKDRDVARHPEGCKSEQQPPGESIRMEEGVKKRPPQNGGNP